MRSASFSSNFQTSLPCMRHKLFSVPLWKFSPHDETNGNLFEKESSLKLTDKIAKQNEQHPLEDQVHCGGSERAVSFD